ncbi:MAG: L-threonylcarbamoyladenylate synthase, partial [Burkholderiaceae bacterium]|nr:L-threonylcarbamoyladenylate synthase [Burkholderiaceae bacterium]
MNAAVDDMIRRAAAILESGGLVAFPTETVYGLGADAENPQAVAKIYAAKERPANHPLIVHLAPEADVAYWASEVPEAAKKLIAAFWPGPLTLILKKTAHVPDAATGGQDTVGLRCPSHPVAQALLRAFKHGQGGVVAPSANKFGHVSPTTAQHVQEEFGDDLAIGLILDGGQSEVGIESTILDLSRWET